MEDNGKGNQERRLDGDESEGYWEEDGRGEEMEEVKDGGGGKMKEVQVSCCCCCGCYCCCYRLRAR